MKLCGCAVALAAVAAPATAAADCARDADLLRAQLEDQAQRASRWNLSWQIVFGVSTAIQVTLAATQTNLLGDWDQDVKEQTYINTVKAAIGFGAAIVLPLRVEVPSADADRCADLAVLRTNMARAGKAERNAFWLGHVGGLGLNLTAAAILWQRQSLSVAGISLAESLPVLLLDIYTMPRGAWHTWRDHRDAWSVAVTPHLDGWSVIAGRSF